MNQSNEIERINNTKFSVLMSVYIKENPKFLDESLNSILVKQSIIPDELVLVKDGPLTDELELVIDKYSSKFPSILIIINLANNVGLGEALNFGLQRCSHELIARMDSDDICAYNRFERQLKYFNSNPKLDLVGSNIVEFFDSPDNPKFVKICPADIECIRKMMKRRNAINHVSVMFKKEAVIKAGGYMHFSYMEDYYLWVRMLKNNCNMININENLVFVRTGKEMFKRRGNPESIRSWFKLQKVMKSNNQINILDAIINMLNIIVFTYTPSWVKKYIYKLFLREN